VEKPSMHERGGDFHGASYSAGPAGKNMGGADTREKVSKKRKYQNIFRKEAEEGVIQEEEVPRRGERG